MQIKGGGAIRKKHGLSLLLRWREVPALPSSRCSCAACHTPGGQRHGAGTPTGRNFSPLSRTLQGAGVTTQTAPSVSQLGQGGQLGPGQEAAPFAARSRALPAHSALASPGPFPHAAARGGPSRQTPTPGRLLRAPGLSAGEDREFRSGSAPPALASSLRIPRGMDSGGGMLPARFPGDGWSEAPGGWLLGGSGEVLSLPRPCTRQRLKPPRCLLSQRDSRAGLLQRDRPAWAAALRAPAGAAPPCSVALLIPARWGGVSEKPRPAEPPPELRLPGSPSAAAAAAESP